jgi:hypothetical protein
MTLDAIPPTEDRQHSRAAKQLGNFGEGLVTYNLIRKGFEVAYVDHVGAALPIPTSSSSALSYWS